MSLQQGVPPDIKDNVILRPIWDAVHQGMNRIVLVNGLPRTGKSEWCINAAYQLYRGPGPKFEHKFDTKLHCKWSKIGFQKMVRDYTDIGACLMWDEAGISELGAHARQFWSESNIAISTLFQIMGFHNQVAFISLPMRTMLDKHLRMLSHINVETLKIDKKRDRCLARVFWIEMSTRKENEIISKYPRFINSDGLRCKVIMASVPRAPLEIRKEYEVYSKVFKSWLEDKLIYEAEQRSIKRTSDVEEKNKVGVNDGRLVVFNKIKANPTDCWNQKKKAFDVNAIMLAGDISRQDAYTIKAWLNKEKVIV